MDARIGFWSPHEVRQLRRLIANSTWFDGVLGHHARGLEQLAKFWNTLRRHVHSPFVRHFDLPVAGAKPFRVYECRCGTTTQIDKMGYNAKSLMGGFPVRPNWPANTLLVHHITAGATGTVVWRVETFVRKRQGFASLKVQTFRL